MRGSSAFFCSRFDFFPLAFGSWFAICCCWCIISADTLAPLFRHPNGGRVEVQLHGSTVTSFKTSKGTCNTSHMCTTPLTGTGPFVPHRTKFTRIVSRTCGISAYNVYKKLLSCLSVLCRGPLLLCVTRRNPATRKM